MEKFPNRIKVEFNRKDEYEKIIKQQSKLTSNGIHHSHTNYDGYTFKQNEVLMHEPNHEGVDVLEIYKLLMHETYRHKLQPYFGEKIIQLQSMDTDSFILSI